MSGYKLEIDCLCTYCVQLTYIIAVIFMYIFARHLLIYAAILKLMLDRSLP